MYQFTKKANLMLKIYCKKLLRTPKILLSLTLSIIVLLNLLSTRLAAQPLADSKPKFVGNIIKFGFDIPSNFTKYWNQVTAENAGKWESVEGSRGSYNWTQLDNIYNFAISNDLLYRHHTLVWGQQEPGWISGLDESAQLQAVTDWIKAVGERYPDADYVDVVNEPLHAPPSYKEALGGDGETGWDWVIRAFELAREYLSPDTELHLNEYNVINGSTAANNYLEVINILNERGLIDGIGVQGHSFEVAGVSANRLRSNLDILASSGLPVYITEFDINREDDDEQLEQYQTVFPALYEHPAVQGITLWGYRYFETWQEYAFLLDQRGAPRPSLEWLETYLASPFSPKLKSPASDSTDTPRDPLLTWIASDSADSYNVQLSASSRFTPVVLDTSVTGTSLQLGPLNPNTRYYWRVSASNEKGTSLFSDISIFTTGGITGIGENKFQPDGFKLLQNYPNPFNPSTQIQYSIPEQSFVSLKLFNSVGQQVALLYEGIKSAGNYRVQLDATELVSGVYLYQLKANEFIESRKMIVLK